MISTVIWISSTEARSFRLAPAKIEERRFHSHDIKKGRYENAQHASKAFFHDVAQALMTHNEDRYLLLGPGPTKLHFLSYVKEHNPAAFERVVGVESVDKLTDGEILDLAHRHFKKIDTFEKSV